MSCHGGLISSSCSLSPSCIARFADTAVAWGCCLVLRSFPSSCFFLFWVLQFGPVIHVFVDKASRGRAHLKFRDEATAARAQRALHGREFAGRKITCEFQHQGRYDARFGLM